MKNKNLLKGSRYPRGLANVEEATGFLRLPQVVKLLGIGRVSVYDKIKKGLIKPPIKLGSRTSVWLRKDIENYIDCMVKTREVQNDERTP